MGRLLPRGCLTLDDDELMQIIRGGKPQIGMPAFALNDADMRGLIRYLRTLERPEGQPRIRASVQTTHGEPSKGWSCLRAWARCNFLRRPSAAFTTPDRGTLPRGHFRCRLERL